MCKPHISPVRKSGDRMCRACDTGLSQCPPRLPGTVVSSSGNHSTSLFWFFFFPIPSCNSLKGASYQRAAFSSFQLQPCLPRICWCSVGGMGERRQLCAGKECQSWHDLRDCTAVLPPDRCSWHHLTAVRSCPCLCTVYTAHTNLLCTRGRLKPFPFLCLLFASLLGSHDLSDIRFHQLSSQPFP